MSKMKRKSGEAEVDEKRRVDPENGCSPAKKMILPAEPPASTSKTCTAKEFAECWSKYGLNNQSCTLHSGNNPKRNNCKDNPYCLFGLGMDKWEKAMAKVKKLSTTTSDDNRKRDILKQPCGLCNLGNTCYMNSFLQVWFNDVDFRQCVFDWQPSDNFQAPPESLMDVQVVMNALQRLFVQMQISPYEDTSAEDLVGSLRLDNAQQDAQEFATLFFGALEHHLANHPNGAAFRHLINTHFTGETKHTITCTACGRTSERVATFQSLQLPIENIKTLTEALNCYFGFEQLDDYRCDQCDARGTAKRRAQLVRLPPVVVIQLNRYHFDNKGKKKKFNHPVQFRRQLSLVEYAANKSEASKAALYELCAVMVHQGTGADCGHYYDLIKEQVTGGWFKYNDQYVTAVTKAPGVDVESPSPRTTGAPEEQKGCYALVYRRVDGGAVVRPNPPRVIAKEITETLHATIEADTRLNSAAETLISQRSHSKFERLQRLWTKLEVRKTSPQFASSITFLPTKLLTDIQSRELQMVLDDSKDGAAEEYTKLGKTAMEEQLRDTPLPFERQSLALCPHGKIPVTLFRNGELKAVNRNTAHLMLEEYGVHDLQLLTGEDICVDCLKQSEADQRFKDELESDYSLLSSIAKNKAPNDGEPIGGYWLGRASFYKMRKMALEKRAIDNQVHGEPRVVVFEPQVLSPKKDKGTADAEPSSSTNGSATVQNGFCSRVSFNDELKCEHGRLDPHANKKFLVPNSMWDIVVKYFGNSAFAVQSDQSDCPQCLDDMAANTETAAELDKVAEQIKSKFPWLRTLSSRKWSEWTAPGRPDADRAKFALCRQFVDWLVKFTRSKSNRSPLKQICNECAMCKTHQRPMFPLGDEHESEMCCVVPLTEREWQELTSFEFFDQSDQQVIAVIGEGASATFKDYCDECFVTEMNKRREDRYYYHNGTVNVSLKSDSASDAPEDQSVRRSARPRRGKDHAGVMISSNEKVIELKVRLMAYFNASPKSQLLFKNDGTELEDEMTLQESRIASGDVIKLIIQQAVDDDDDGKPRELERGFKNTALAQL